MNAKKLIATAAIAASALLGSVTAHAYGYYYSYSYSPYGYSWSNSWSSY